MERSDECDDTTGHGTLALAQSSLDNSDMSQQEIDATNTGGGGAHLVVYTKTVFELVFDKFDDLEQGLQNHQKRIDFLMRGRTKSMLSSTINAFIYRVLLVPLVGVSDDHDRTATKNFLKALRSDAATAAEASQLLAASGVDISLDQLLDFRGTFCRYSLPHSTSRRGLEDRAFFEQLVGELTELNPADRALLTQVHTRELAEVDEDEYW
jgi:hypothetical protein